MIYSNDAMTPEQLYDFVVESGGTIQKLSDSFTQGCIQKQDEVIWIRHDDQYFLGELEKAEWDDLRENHHIVPQMSVIISIGLNGNKQRSISLARWFCRQLQLRLPHSVVDIFDRFYPLDMIDNIETGKTEVQT